LIYANKFSFATGGKSMAERLRPIQLKFYVTEEEKAHIQKKMALMKIKNMSGYLRKMAIDGYIIQVDYTEQKKLAAAVNKVGANFNQICKRVNSTGHCYEEDLAEMKELMKQIWQLLKSNQSEEL